ncbi:unnamed protein product [Miscanthus lutarioriparius]|uniref:Uncharacterized protein n=1 Tax=Miscanthus lutarioriparius TaxID=422564 RepID=A0A811SIJ0_9POAL|nr:unnamed protein product [Miscanthus lutarioriparius]
MEKSMDSGVLHDDEGGQHRGLVSDVKPASALDLVVNDCSTAIEKVNLEIYSTEGQVKNLADIRATIHSCVQGDGKKPPLCKYSCPPPPEKPCSANETAIVDKLSGVYNAWVATEKFLTELLPPAEVNDKEAPKKYA